MILQDILIVKKNNDKDNDDEKDVLSEYPVEEIE